VSAEDWVVYYCRKVQKIVAMIHITQTQQSANIISCSKKKKSKLIRDYLFPFYILESRDSKWQHFSPILNAEFLQVIS